MSKKTTVGIAHSDADLGKPADCTRAQLDIVKGMIRDIADQTMGGMSKIVKRGDKVLIKINTVIPVPANEGFTTDPRMLEALIELVQEQNPAQILIGERCAMGGDTSHAMEVCGIAEVAKRTGAELCPFEHVPFDMYKIDRPISFNEFPVPRPVRDADVYIGLPKMKVHVHTVFTGAHEAAVRQSSGLRLDGPLPPRRYLPEDLQPDTRRESQMVRDGLSLCLPGQRTVQRVSRRSHQGLQHHLRRARSAWRSIPYARLSWTGTSRAPTCLPRCWARPRGWAPITWTRSSWPARRIDKVKRRFRRHTTVLQGPFPNVKVIMGSTCEAGCKAIVRMQLDQAKADGTLDKLKRPLYVFTGLQFEEVKPVDGDVILVGDCAKPLLERFPDAQYWGSSEQFPNCTPIWANNPAYSISNYIRKLADISK